MKWNVILKNYSTGNFYAFNIFENVEFRMNIEKLIGKTLGGRVILKLLIPEDAERTCDTKRECRATKVKVLEIQTIQGDVLIDSPSDDCAVSIKNHTTEYHVGEIITVPDISADDGFFRWNGVWHYERGLFFFVNRKEAVFYLSAGEDGDGNPIDAHREFIRIMKEKSEMAGIEAYKDTE